MSAALRPDDAPDDAAGCAHAEIHWHPAKTCPGTPDGAGPGGAEYRAQGGICRRCRQPMLRTGVTAWSPAAPVSGADPVWRAPIRRQHG